MMIKRIISIDVLKGEHEIEVFLATLDKNFTENNAVRC